MKRLSRADCWCRTTRSHNLVALEVRLRGLAATYPRKSQLVEMRFFGGRSVEETTDALHVSRDNVMRDSRLAKQ